MSNAISGTRRQVRELVDGTLEVRVHIDPRYKSDFHRLFPAIDAPIALAPLVQDFERREPVEPRTGGAIAKWLGARCHVPVFQQFLAETFGEWSTPIDTPDAAAALVRHVCGVASRAEIDHDERARGQFERAIRRPYMEWCARRNTNNTHTEA